ncbi:MAG: peptide chain release factor 1 [Rhodospirillales bacterium]
MTQQDFEQKLDELDKLLNDPEVQLEPNRVWSLLAEVTEHDLTRDGDAV